MTTLEAHSAIVPVLNFIGFAVKKSPVKDWTIPFILAAVGAIAFPAITQFSGENVVQGVLAASAAIAANQALRQGSEALKATL
mgnify:CR=1 FL=1